MMGQEMDEELMSALRSRGPWASWVCAGLAAVVSVGCGSSPTSPSSALAGRWSGTTSQSRPISFVISGDQFVTAMAIDYLPESCPGAKALAGLRIPIQDA